MKFENILKLSILVISAYILTLTGCSDTTTTTGNPSSGNVNGKVVDVYGAPVSGATVAIGATTAVSGADGNFTINSVTAPYNLKIVVTTATPPTGIVYQGINTFNPQVYAPGLTSSPLHATLNVTIPALLANQKATIIFTDNAFIHTFTTVTTPAVMGTLNVNWLSGATITGKIIVLVYTSAGGQITTYDKYGEKTNYVLNSGGTVNETFTPAELSVNPGEANVSGTLVLPAGYITPSTVLLLKFSSQGSIALGANPGNPVTGTSFSFVVPTGLPSNFTIGLEGNGSGATGEYSTKVITAVSGSTTNTINLETAPVLSTPPNASTGVDTTTNFTFSSGTGTGFYIITFTAPGKNFTLFSNSASVTLPNFSAFGISIGSSLLYSWNVAKFHNIASVNDFVSTYLVSNPNYNSVAYSSNWTFTSKP